MVAIVSGTGLGLQRTSAFIIGSNGQLGSAGLGRDNSGAYVNAATGNLVLTRLDEVLAATGPDVLASRTYNSLGLLNDDNGDNWRLGLARRVVQTTGSYGAVGSTVTRTDWDGSELVYNWDSGRAAYVSKEGAGAYDILTKSGTTWTWTDGDTRVVELYDESNSGRITQQKDADDNTSNFAYENANPLLLTRVTTPTLDDVRFIYSGNNLSSIKQRKYDPVSGTYTTSVTTLYTYDIQNRLSRVDVDFSQDGLVADGNSYWIAYEYKDSTSRLITRVTQKDGTNVTIAYDAVNRVSSLTQLMDGTVSAVTSFAYAIGQTVITDALGVKTTLIYDNQNQLIRTLSDAKAQNVALQSEALDNTSTWTVPTGTVTRTANDPARPLPNGGPSTAEKLVFSASGATLQQVLADANTGGAAGGSYAGDFWVYAATTTTITVKLLDSVGENFTTVSLAAGVWTQVKASRIFAASSTNRRIQLIGTAANQTVWVTQARVRSTATDDAYVLTATAAVGTSYVSADAAITQFAYDADGNVTLKSRYLNKANCNAGIYIEQESSRYDINGNLVELVNGRGETIRWTYGANNQVLSETRFTALDADGASTASNNLRPLLTDAAQWTGVNASSATAGSLDGFAARQYSVQTGGTIGYISSAGGDAVANGDTLTLSLSLKAVGAVTTHYMGFLGSISSWGGSSANSLRIVSGPGSVGEAGSGLWTISGLSATETTRIEFTRSFTQAETAQFIFYIQNMGAPAAGASVIMAGPQLVKQTGNPLQPSGGMVTRYVYDEAANGIADDGSAVGDDAAENHLRFTVSPEGRVTEYRYDGLGRLNATLVYAADSYTGTIWTEAALANFVGTASQTQVMRTDYAYDWRSNLSQTISYTVTQAAALAPGHGGYDHTTVDYTYDMAGRLLSRRTSGYNSQGGEPSLATETFAYDSLGRVISVTDLYGVNSTIAISDSTRTTTITTPNEPTRTQVFKIGGGIESETVSAPAIASSATSYAYDQLGRLRIKTIADGSPSGLRTYFIYDNQSRLVAQIDEDLSVTEFKYDAANRLVATIAYANVAVLTAGQLSDLRNPAVALMLSTYRPATSADDRWAWTAYDKSGKVIETIDAAGSVVSYGYDGAGRQIARTRYFNQLSAGDLSNFRTAPPSAAVLPAASTGNDRVSRNFYDNDGLLIGALDEEGYLIEIVYDKAGRKIETIGYPAAATVDLASSTFAALKTSILATANYLTVLKPSEIHNYWIYDGRGQVRATIDGEGNVTRYHYTARGTIDQEVRGQQVPANTSYTLASLPAASGTLETTTFTRNAAGQMLSQVRNLTAGTETTTCAYDNRGRLLSQTVIDAPGTYTEARSQTFRYDAKGRLVGQLSGQGSAALAALVANPSQAEIDNIYATYGTQYVYDSADRLVMKISPSGTDASGVKTFYYYDTDGQLRFEVVEDKYYSAATSAWVVRGGAITEYRYSVLEDRTDALVYQTWLPAATLASLTGGLTGTAITTPVGTLANAAQDSANHWNYNILGQVRQATGTYGTSTNTYTPFGELTQVDTAGLASRQIGYTRRGQVGWDYAIADWGNPTSVLRSQLYYDAFGRQNAQTENFTDLRAQYFGYDRAGRANAAIDAMGKSESSGYDARSNVISHTDRANNTATVSYDLFNRNVTTTSAEGIITRVKKNAFGQAIEIADGKGVVTKYEYDKDGNLTKITEDFGTAGAINPNTGKVYLNRATTQGFDAADHLIDVVDAGGTRTRFTYDALGRVMTEVRDQGTGTNPATGKAYLNLITTYEYDAKGQRTKVTDASNTVTTYAFDRGGQVLTLIQDAGAGRFNLTTKFEYNRADGKVTKRIEAFGTAQQRVTDYDYDGYGRLTQEVEDSGGLNLTIQYFYDVNSNLVMRTDGAGTAQARSTRFIYDLSNRLVLTIDAEGGVVQNFYDAEDQMVAVRQFANLLTSTQIAALADPALPAQWNEVTTAPNGDVTLIRKVRDYATNVTTPSTVATLVAVATDRKTRTLYDRDGRATIAIDGEGFATRNVLDAGGNVIQAIRYAVKPSVDDASTAASLATWLATNPQITASTAYEYDALNRVTKVTDPEAAVTVITYDPLGRFQESVAASGSSDSVTTRVDYDALGRVIDEARAYGTSDTVTTHYVYDALGQVSDATVAFGTSDAVTMHRTYDALGRVLSEVRDYGSGLNQQGFAFINATTAYTYDALGRLVKTIDPRGNAAYAFYDGVDRMTWQVDAEGYVTKYEYLTGAATKVTRYLNPASNAALVSPTVLPTVSADSTRDQLTYAYTDKLGRTVLQVDGEGFVVKTEYGFGGEIAKVTRFGGQTQNLVSVSLATPPLLVTAAPTPSTQPYVLLNPSDTTKTRDAATSFEYDKNGRVTKSTDAEGFFELYGYDALGNRNSFTSKLGGVTTYTYYKTGLLKTEVAQQKSYDANGAALLDNGVAATTLVTSYTYDARGNLKNKTVGSNLAAANQLTTGYDYDKLDRLKKQTDPSFVNPDLAGTSLTPITQWEYDKRGNVRLQIAPDDGKTFTYFDAQNRKKAEISPVGTLSEWAYDANGNLTNQKIWATPVAIPASTAAAQPTPMVGDTARETQLDYDKVDRLITSRVMNVRTGAFNGSAFVTSAAQTLTSTNQFDGLGNLIKEIDANLNAIFHWYDRNGRETAKLDQEQYLTSWVRDADGNVTGETRFANRFAGTPGTAVAPGVTADALSDRTTTFTYDRMGRRLTETRKALLVATISGNTVSTSSQDATVGYAYNGLGEVASKTEATGDRTDYQYDAQGRLIRQLDAVQSDFNASGAASVRHVVYFKYDAANNLVFATERAEAGTAALDSAITPDAMGTIANGYLVGDDRATKYLYTGGKLTGMTDAMNFTRSYTFDVAGRKVAEYYTRTKSDGTTVTEGNFTGYDLAGRATSQWQATRSGTVWTALWPRTLIGYNAYGEATSRAMMASAGDTTPLVQEQMFYDQAGRVVKTNAGDGIWKVLVYDANGNATLTLSAITADMSAANYNIDGALAAFGAVDSSTNATMTATITLYDKRNMATGTREPQRQIDNSTTTPFYTITRARNYTAFGEVASETDARGNTTNYLYNTMGKAIRSIAPAVSITNEDGGSQFVLPTSDYYYDKSGRLVATRDANGSYAAGGTSTAGGAKLLNTPGTDWTGNLTTRQLLAGTGYGGSEAKVLNEYRADISVWESRYDVFGQLRVTVDGLNSSQKAAAQAYVTTQYLYDKGGRVTAEVKPSGYTEYYAVDELGQRTKHWNSFLGSFVLEKTDYDVQGRVTRTSDYLNHATTYTYTWSATSYNLLTGPTAMENHGSWIKTTSYLDVATATRTMSEGIDEFGHITTRTDLSGNVTNFAYDRGGRLTQQTSSLGQNITYSYYNTGKVKTIIDTAQQSMSYYTGNVTSNFTYDVQGNRLTSRYDATSYYQYYYYYYYSTPITYTSNLENATASYDALNRVTQITDPGDAANKRPSFTLNRTYDANGNVRSAITDHQSIDSNQNLILDANGLTKITSDTYWYRYDSLNRIVISKGKLSGGMIARGLTGSELTYNLSGQRATSRWSRQYMSTRAGPRGEARDVYNSEDNLENYNYDADGNLSIVTIATVNITSISVYQPMPTASGAGTLRVSDTRDAMGRVTDHMEFKSDGITLAFRRQVTQYNNASQVMAENTSGLLGTSSTTYNYGINGSTYANGAVVSQGGSSTNTLGQTSNNTINNTFLWRDRALQYQINNVQSGGTTTSTFTYNANNYLTYVSATGATPKQISYTTDAVGQIMVRAQTTNGSTTSPKDFSFFFNGVKIGGIGNNGTDNVDYATAIGWDSTTDGTGAFRKGAATGTSFSDFDQNWTGINPAAGLEGANSSYTVQAGQTLSGIAQALWGDASLWYLLAQANGLTSENSVTAGQVLTVPAQVTNFHNSASTYKPYDAAKAIGDVAPGAPKPPKKNCFAMILIAVVAIAVAMIVTAGAASIFAGQGLSAMGSILGAMTGGAAAGGVGIGAWVAGGAIGGAIGSIASQGVGIALGVQSKISWKGVALAGIGGGIGGAFQGLGNAAKLATEGAQKALKAGEVLSSAARQAAVKASLGSVGGFLANSGTLNTISRAVISSGLTQGIGKLTHLQDKISWGGIAGAALSAGLMEKIGAPSITGENGNASISNIATNLGASMAGNIVNAAARSVIDGGDFGDNVLAALPDTIAQTIMDVAMRHATKAGDAARTAEADRNAQQQADQQRMQAIHADPIAAAADLSVPLQDILSVATDPQQVEQIRQVRGQALQQNLPKQTIVTSSGTTAQDQTTAPDGKFEMRDGRTIVYAPDGQSFANAALNEVVRGTSGEYLAKHYEEFKGLDIAGNLLGGLWPERENAQAYVDYLKAFSVPGTPQEAQNLTLLFGELDAAVAKLPAAPPPLVVSAKVEGPNFFQRNWDYYVADPLTGAARDRQETYEAEARRNDQFFDKHPVLGVLAKPFRLMDNFGFGVTVPFSELPGGIATFISHPKRTAIGAINAFDGVLRNDSDLDGRPDAPLMPQLRKMSARDFAVGAGKFTGNVVMFVAPEAKIGSLRAVSFEARAIDVSSAGGRTLLSNAEVRTFYNQQIKALDTSGSLSEATAMRVHDARNALKLEARDLMSDRAAAAQLAREQPVQPFQYYVDKYSVQGYRGDALWQRIIQGSTTPNPVVNSKFGIK